MTVPNYYQPTRRRLNRTPKRNPWGPIITIILIPIALAAILVIYLIFRVAYSVEQRFPGGYQPSYYRSYH